MTNDILIIGAGVVGCALARELSRYTAEVTVLDRGADVAEGASKANSGIVHAGYDALPGSLKARLNVEGAEMFGQMCRELGVPYRKNGAMVVAFHEEDIRTLRRLMDQAEANGVRSSFVEQEELRRLEPQINPEAVAALLIPDSAITSPYELTYALADHAAINGVRFRLGEEVRSVSYGDGFWHVTTSKAEYTCRVLINCAGSDSALLHNQMSPEQRRVIHRRGQYYVLDHPRTLPFERTMFQCPTEMGKGVLVSPTVHGNVLLGPTAEDIPDPLAVETTAEGLEAVLKTARLTWPQAQVRTAVTTFSGVRAHETGDDFVIGAVTGAPHAYEALGIDSPGLSSAPAIARMLGDRIAQEEGLVRKTSWQQLPQRPKAFNEMTLEEQRAAVEANPLNGNIICRCEVVTEAEIRDAIRRPVGATSIDGVKRRTRAGMGRCQGGFCSPRVAEILAEELGVDLLQVTKNGGHSTLLCGTIRDVMKEGKL